VLKSTTRYAPQVLCIALLAGGSPACQGGYPIAPTLCDDLCDAQDRVSCMYYLQDPAECVVSCESSYETSNHECDPALRAFIECLRHTPPGTNYCGTQPCQQESNDLNDCLSVNR
jgi:hypothetical protein